MLFNLATTAWLAGWGVTPLMAIDVCGLVASGATTPQENVDELDRAGLALSVAVMVTL